MLCRWTGWHRLDQIWALRDVSAAMQDGSGERAAKRSRKQAPQIGSIANTHTGGERVLGEIQVHD